MINAGKQGVFSWKGRVAEDRGEKNGELKEIVKILVSILKPQTDRFWGKYGLICENSREMFISIDHCIIHASADRGGPGWWISDKADVFALWSKCGTVVGCIVHIRKIGNKCKIYV